MFKHSVLLYCYPLDWWGAGLQCSSVNGVKFVISKPLTFNYIYSYISQLVCIKVYSILKASLPSYIVRFNGGRGL